MTFRASEPAPHFRSLTSAFFELPLLNLNALPVAAGWVEGRLERPELEAHLICAVAAG